MASEDPEILLAKISQLQGKIDQRKSGQYSVQPSQYHQPSRTHSYPSMEAPTQLDKRIGNTPQGFPHTSNGLRGGRGGYSSRGYSRRGRPPPVHRNRTLVLNKSTPTTDANSSSDNMDTSSSTTNSPAPAWISKTDRHRQLINSSIYEKESQNRTRAMEESWKQKEKQKIQRRTFKFFRNIQHTSDVVDNYEIVVQGIRFRVVKNGYKLVKVPGEGSRSAVTQERSGRTTTGLCLPGIGDLNAAKATPKTAMVGGARFVRSKNGNMVRYELTKSQRYERSRPDLEWMPHSANLHQIDRTRPVRKINEPCKMFSTTGSCTKGPRCRYIHDPSKVAVCVEFLQKGLCPSGDKCDLSHELTPERTLPCLHFTRGNCSNPNCRYTHVRVSPAAPVCRAFGIYGYCEKGTSCQERHAHECPDFSNTGICPTKGCKLPHRHKASHLRGSTTLGNPVAEYEDSDVSSDEEDEDIDSDDADSDDLDEEFFGDEDGKTDSDIPAQLDYVQLS